MIFGSAVTNASMFVPYLLLTLSIWCFIKWLCIKIQFVNNSLSNMCVHHFSFKSVFVMGILFLLCSLWERFQNILYSLWKIIAFLMMSWIWEIRCVRCAWHPRQNANIIFSAATAQATNALFLMIWSASYKRVRVKKKIGHFFLRLTMECDLHSNATYNRENTVNVHNLQLRVYKKTVYKMTLHFT